MDFRALKLPIPLRFADRHSWAFSMAFCAAMLMQVRLHTATVSLGSSASKAFCVRKTWATIKCQHEKFIYRAEAALVPWHVSVRRRWWTPSTWRAAPGEPKDKFHKAFPKSHAAESIESYRRCSQRVSWTELEYQLGNLWLSPRRHVRGRTQRSVGLTAFANAKTLRRAALGRHQSCVAVGRWKLSANWLTDYRKLSLWCADNVPCERLLSSFASGSWPPESRPRTGRPKSGCSRAAARTCRPRYPSTFASARPSRPSFSRANTTQFAQMGRPPRWPAGGWGALCRRRSASDSSARALRPARSLRRSSGTTSRLAFCSAGNRSNRSAHSADRTASRGRSELWTATPVAARATDRSRNSARPTWCRARTAAETRCGSSRSGGWRRLAFRETEPPRAVWRWASVQPPIFSESPECQSTAQSKMKLIPCNSMFGSILPAPRAPSPPAVALSHLVAHFNLSAVDLSV